MMVRDIAVDIGNDNIKALTNDGGKYYIPNVIAEAAKERNIVDMEKDVLDGLHVQVVSSALGSGKKTVYVGNLARKQAVNDELTSESKKSENDQSIVMLLTTIALDSVKNSEEASINVSYNLSTGLPMRESMKKGTRKTFKEKLLNGIHEVKFLDTPIFGNRSVCISFENVIVSPEGKAAYIEMVTAEDGSVKNEEAASHSIMLVDIGGLTTDVAVIQADGQPDNTNSRGLNQGVSVYLDRIIEEVEMAHDIKIKTRKDLVHTILGENGKSKGFFYHLGHSYDIRSIIDKHLTLMANEIYKTITSIWTAAPDVRFSYLIGGGSAVLAESIHKINDSKRKFPIRTFSADESIWMIANAYMKILEFSKPYPVNS